MPHVTVHFDPTRVDQALINKLKKVLQSIVAEALSSPLTLSTTNSEREDIRVSPEEIYVRQQAAHETDINPAPVEILVEAGRSKGRKYDVVAKLIDSSVCHSKILPDNLLGEGQTCVWVKFCEENAFRFIKLRQKRS